jgi:hypothetical protein
LVNKASKFPKNAEIGGPFQTYEDRPKEEGRREKKKKKRNV